jgi:uncharacterized protein (DUF305 family)
LQALAVFAVHDREFRWLGRDQEIDQTFMRHMSMHHQQGIELASMVVEKAVSPHLQNLAKLMGVSQNGEKQILENWWASWFGLPMQVCSAHELATRPSLLDAAQIEQLHEAPRASFDALFVELMTLHHSGAVKMADKELRDGADPRLRIMAHVIRHEQNAPTASTPCCWRSRTCRRQRQ